MNLLKGVLWFSYVYLINLNICPVKTLSVQQPETQSSVGLVYIQREVLNSSDGLFGVLEWTFYQNESKVTFNLTPNVAIPRLNIVLGSSKTGDKERADLIVIKGNLDGPYKFENIKGTSKNGMEPNLEEMWKLDSVKNVQSVDKINTTITISRNITTCDSPNQTNICINDGMLHILWGFDQSLHTESPSSKTFNLLGKIKTYLTDPQVQPPSPKEFQTWKVSRTYDIPKRQTSYWCNIQKAPYLQTAHHIIGYAPYFADSTSEDHIHHQLLYRCATPPGINSTQIFEPLLDFPGEECYLEETHQLPSQFCTEMVYAWNRGGKPFYFPENVGVPLGGHKNEYFLLEIHYDNPNKVGHLKVESGINVLYSSNIRPIESSILLVGFGTLGLYMVPPNSVDFKTGGLCSSDCTTDMFTDATSIIAANLHAHKATHKIQLRHFRGDKELPSILFDNNYDASFQIMRLLNSPVRILPGDQLGVECVMNTGNETILSGFSTRNEMCFAFLFIDKRLDYLYCSSEYPTAKTLDRYGIQKISWDQELQERVIRKADNHPELEGSTLQSVLDKDMRNWGENTRKDFEMEQMFGIHDSNCPPTRKLVRIAFRKIGNESGDRAKRLKYLQKTMKLTLPNTETVSTPGFMGRICEYPKSKLSIEATSASSKLTKFDIVFKLVMFVLILYML